MFPRVTPRIHFLLLPTALAFMCVLSGNISLYFDRQAVWAVVSSLRLQETVIVYAI